MSFDPNSTRRRGDPEADRLGVCVVHVGFHHREGLVLSTVTYQDEQSGFLRPLFYRLSIAEMGERVSFRRGRRRASKLTGNLLWSQSFPMPILVILILESVRFSHIRSSALIERGADLVCSFSSHSLAPAIDISTRRLRCRRVRTRNSRERLDPVSKSELTLRRG